MNISTGVGVVVFLGLLFLTAGMNPKSWWGFVGVTCILLAAGLHFGLVHQAMQWAHR